MNFERNKEIKEALNLGLKTPTDLKIQKLLELHAEIKDSPIVIEHIEITDNYDVAIYYANVKNVDTCTNASIYLRNHLKDANLNFFLENTEPTFEKHPELDYINILKYTISRTYMNSFTQGMIYKLPEK